MDSKPGAENRSIEGHKSDSSNCWQILTSEIALSVSRLWRADVKRSHPYSSEKKYDFPNATPKLQPWAKTLSTVQAQIIFGTLVTISPAYMEISGIIQNTRTANLHVRSSWNTCHQFLSFHWRHRRADSPRCSNQIKNLFFHPSSQTRC